MTAKHPGVTFSNTKQASMAPCGSENNGSRKRNVSLVYHITTLVKTNTPDSIEITMGNAMHSFCSTENAGMLAAAALEELAACACEVAVAVTLDVDDDSRVEVEVALAVLVVDVVFGLGSSLSSSR